VRVGVEGGVKGGGGGWRLSVEEVVVVN